MSAMDKNSVPPKTKPPPSESSEESGSSEEATEDEEQAEGGSGFESGSDESTDTTKKKLINILPVKQQSAVKPPATPASPAKRTREANGKKEKVEEPSTKKKKIEVVTPTSKPAPRISIKPLMEISKALTENYRKSLPAAPPSDKKNVVKIDKSKPTPASKEKQVKDSAEKDTKKSATKSTKKSPASAAKPTSSKSEDDAAQKPKTDVRHWSHEEELALSREIQRDRVDDVYGSSLPAARSDPYWDTLMSRLPFVNQYEEELRRERLCEKVRRMRLRYESLNTRLKAGETSVYKNAHEGVLWRIWHTIWGPNKATPSMLNGDDEEDDEMEEDEESGSEEEGSEEEDEEDVPPTQVKGRPSAVVGKATAPQKAIGKKVMADDSSSDDDDSNDEDSPAKAPPPAPAVVQATPAPATAAARKPSPAPKPVATREPAPIPMDPPSTGRNASQRNGAQNNHAIIPALLEKSVRPSALPKVSDEMRAENLALLRDMRGTCVKMVEEAKSQSLHITEKMLDETRLKATLIVEEAKLKSAEILEELRLFVEKITAGIMRNYNNNNNNNNNISGNSSQNQRGGYIDYEDPFQVLGLRLGSPIQPLVIGDPNLDRQWKEQGEAEQGILLQRLQLVQEQARLHQEGIRLRLEQQKLQLEEKTE